MRLGENDVKLTEYKFRNNVQNFLVSILKDPVGTKVPSLLLKHGIDRVKLFSALKKFDVIVRSRKIVDKDNEGNPKPAKMMVKYMIKKKGLSNKLSMMYRYLVMNVLHECEGAVACAVADGGATNAQSSGQYIQPLFGGKPQRRKIYNVEETTTTSNVGNISYDAPISVNKDDESLKRKRGFSVKRLK